MNSQPDGRQEAFQVEQLQQIERACEQFQTAWKAGKRPRIEDYLAVASDDCRSELLQRLVAQELICRSRSGETPTAEEYERRFPADATTVRQAFSRWPLSPSERSEHSTHSNQNAAVAETETQQWEGPGERASGVAEQPEHIGRYKVLGILGRGGFGTVYRARDEELKRDVAIKVWRRDRFAGDEDIERLLQEARHVARLEKHAAIVGVYDVGRQEDGSVFMVLQYIEGHTLEHELKSHKLAPDRVWEIMMQVTSAIQHAHATGLVHRDLKPANVLLDADGNSHVADFGLAIDDQSQRLHAGEVSGTPAYMAPEQVRGEVHRLDGRADLWALGVMLYEMLTRRRPFRGESHQELFDEILHREPKPPRQLDPEIPADLERICLKCLSKSVTDRYLTAADLAKDLRHVHEAPQRRKRRLLTIASAVAAGLVVLGAVWAYLVAAGSQPVISVQPTAGLKIRHRATLRGHTDAVWSVAFSPDDRTLASAGVDMTVKLWDVPDAHEIQQLTGHRGEVRCVAFAPDGQTLASASNDRSMVLWVRETGKLQRQITGHTGDVRSVVFLPNGKQLVSASVDKTIRFWDLQSGSEQKRVETHKAAIQSVTCSRDGKMLASSSDDKTIELLSPETGAVQRTLTGHTDGVSQAAFSPDGGRLASASWDKTIRIWDVATGDVLRTIEMHEDAVRSVAFSPDGKRLASGGNDNTIRLWDARTGVEQATLRGHTGPVTSVAFSADGRILASASADKTVMMWELEEAGPTKPEDRSIVKQPSRKQSKPPASLPEPPDTKSQVESDGKAPVAATEPKLAEWVPLVKSEEDLKAWQKTGPGTVTLDSGDVRVQNAAVTYRTPAADLAIRTQIQNEVNVKPNVRLLLRETPAGSYAAVLENGSRLIVGVTEGDKWRELKSAPVTVTPDQPLALEFSAVGDVLTVLVNGQPLIEVRDTTHRYGSPGLAVANDSTVFKGIEVKLLRGKEVEIAKTRERLQPAKPAAGPPSEPPGPAVAKSGDKAPHSKTPTDTARPFPIGQWVPVLKLQDDLVKWKVIPPSELPPSELMKWKADPDVQATVTAEGAELDDAMSIAIWAYPVSRADVAIRARVKKVSGQNLSLYLRSSPGEFYSAWFNGGNDFGVGAKKLGQPFRGLATVRTAESFNDFFDFEFAAVGNQLRVFVNGQRIISFEDSSVTHGTPGIGGVLGKSIYRDVEIKVLTTRDGKADKLSQTEQDRLIAELEASHLPPWNLARGSTSPAIAPFDAKQARAHQDAWAKHLGVPVEMTNSIGIKFVLIPPGEFDIGSTQAEVAKLVEQAKATGWAGWYIDRLPTEAPKHRVRITKPFYLGQCEVTQAEYERVVGSNPSKFKDDPTRPAEMINWDEASAFCRKLGELPQEQASRAEYRLPTEAECEYACRAGTTTAWYATDDETALQKQAWFQANSGETTHPVGQKAPNAWGLYDMHGNVWEWCQDWWALDYYGASPLEDPSGPAGGSYRVFRGGSWFNDASYCRASFRYGYDPGDRRDDLGFRLARTVSSLP